MAEPVWLVTGYPGFLARRVLGQVLAAEPGASARLVVPPRQLEVAGGALGALPDEQRCRVTVLEGETSHLDMGLSGVEYRALGAELTHIAHCHRVLDLGVDRSVAETINVAGMREALELAGASPGLAAMLVYSSALVSGDRSGLVLEDELNRGQAFPDAASETWATAERMAQQRMGDLPICVVRPTHVVGDTVTGETGELDGLYVLFLLMVSTPGGWGDQIEAELDLPLDMVPIDYVVRAGHCLVGAGARRTYHLSNPRPPSVRRVAELVHSSAERNYPGVSLAPHTARAFFSVPAARLFARGPKAAIGALAARARYDTHHADGVLRPAGIVCPPFESYVDALVTHCLSRVLGRPPAATKE